MNNFDYYLNTELKPALKWLESRENKDFLALNFKALDSNVLRNILESSDDVICSCYLITYKGVPLYVGEAVKYKRLAIHLWHLSTEPSIFFGLTPDEVKYVNITLLDTVFDKDERKRREVHLRKVYKPILNPAHMGDSCIPRRDRFQAVHTWYNDPDELKKAIDFVTNTNWAWGWHELLHRTPCCNPNNVEVDYGLRQRIEQVLKTLPKEERKNLVHDIGTFLGGCWVTTKTVLTVLERLLSNFESLSEIRTMSVQAASMQARIRLEFLQAVQL